MAPQQSPLQIHLLFHPNSALGRELAKEMFAELMSRPGYPGPRIPVLYACNDGKSSPPAMRSLQREPATRRIYCLLADDCMARPEDGKAISHWGEFARSLLTTDHGPGCAVLPVAIDGGAFHLHPELRTTSFVRLDAKPSLPLQQSELFFQIAVRALELLGGRGGGRAMPTGTAPLQVFVSHAKANLPQDPEGQDIGRGPVLALLDYLAQGPVRAWFDSSQIRPGQAFDTAIVGGIDVSTAFVAVHTDQYSSREWCRREYLRARQLDLPIVVVDALADRDPSSFPYFGNVPRLRWSEAGGGLSMPRRIMHTLLQEALRHQLVAATPAGTEAEVHRMPRQPDLLSLSAVKAHCRTIVYPDPPLPAEMRDVLQAKHRRRMFTTPMLQARATTLRNWRIGLSIAEASDIHRLGKGDEHLQVLVEDLTYLLLLSGAELGYGGAFRHGHDYTSALLDRARSLRALVEAAGQRTDVAPVTHFAGWPKHLDATDADLHAYYRIAHLRRTAEPKDLFLKKRLAEAKFGTGYFRRDQPADETWPEDLRCARQYAHSRGVSVMRQEMNDWQHARVCMGGKLRGYNGLVPGVAEEIWLAIQARQPVFLLGAFGGTTELVHDLLVGKQREELDLAYVQREVPRYRELAATYRQGKHPGPSLTRIRKGLQGKGLGLLRNGLTTAENEQLADCTDPFQIVGWIAKGLRKVRRVP